MAGSLGNPCRKLTFFCVATSTHILVGPPASLCANPSCRAIAIPSLRLPNPCEMWRLRAKEPSLYKMDSHCNAATWQMFSYMPVSG